MKTATLACLCAALTATAAVHAAAPVVGLAGPEVRKLDWNTRMLQSADVNGDGLADLLVANNDRGTVDVLLQTKAGESRETSKTARANRWEPVVEDARFQLERVTTGVAMYDLATGDLNGDGRLDLAYTGDPQALTVQYQQADGTWTETRLAGAPAPTQAPVALRIGDLDGDGRSDLVMLGLKELAIFHQTESGELAAPLRFPLADENCYGLELHDLDGDGRRDIAYLATAKRDALRVRLQNAEGRFGPEQSHEIKDPSSTLQLLTAADAKTKTAARLAFAQQRTGQLEFFTLETDAPSKKTSRVGAVLRPRVFTPRSGGRIPAAYATGDFNGDGREDIATADAEGAQVFVYFRQRDGGFTAAERFPSFADVRSLAAVDWDGDGRSELVAVSVKEQTVGLASVNDEGRLDYPQPLGGSGRPLAVAAGVLVEKGPPTLVVLREEKGRRWLDLVRRTPEGKDFIDGTVLINGLKTDPRAVRLIDANQDGRLDIAVFTPLDALRVFLQGEDGTFTDSSTLTGFRKGLVDNLDAGALTMGDVDGDGKAEMLVSSGGFARALRMTTAGELTVIDQFNARDTTAEITASFVLPGTRGKRAEIVLYDRKGEQFQRLRANKQGVYEVAAVEPAGRIDVVGAELRHIAGGFGVPDDTELFLWGKDRFWWLPVGLPELVAKPAESYTTDLPDIHYADVLAGDLTGDGKFELMTLDPENNMVEILARDEEAKEWVSRLHFKVFEADEHFQGRRGESYEPREAIIADVTGDGKKDLVLLVHDRVLVYPQE
jgi:hypothetical protein